MSTRFTEYEWDFEVINPYTGDIDAHLLHPKLKYFDYMTNEDLLSDKYQLVLVRSSWDMDIGLRKRQRAYVDLELKLLPETFDGGTKVPKHFQDEFKRWLKQRWI